MKLARRSVLKQAIGNRVSGYYCKRIYIRVPVGNPEYISGVSWPQTPKSILEPSHGRVFGGKLYTVNVMMGV